MSPGVRLAKGFNAFLLLLLGVLFVLLLSVIVVVGLTYVGTDSLTSIITVVSIAALVTLCLPLSIIQYLSSKVRTQKVIFLGLTLVFVLSSLAVLVWFLEAELLDAQGFTSLARLLTLLTYAPALIALLAVSRPREERREPYLRAAIVFTSAVAVLLVAVFVTASLSRGEVDAYSTFIFTASIVLDIAILALTAIQILAHLGDKLRYLFAIVLVMYLLSMVGDTLALADSLKVFEAFDDATLIYAAMVIFTGLFLLVYSLSNVKIETVEEVSRRLDDAMLLTSDLVLQSPLAICVCDLDGMVIVANDKFLEICGQSRSEVIGRLNICGGLPVLGVEWSALAGRVRLGETVTIDGIGVDRKERGAAYYRLKLFPTHGSDGRINHLVLVMDDITERKAFEDQLISAKKQTELYVDLMGHDVNNMNQIATGFLEIAEEKLRQEGSLDREDLFLVSKPIEALMNNSRIIYNIRKLQQEKAGAYRPEPVDVGALLAGLAPQYSRVAGREVTINLRVLEPCTVLANELLGDVFGNLLGNAIKHSNGPVTIDVTVRKTSEGGREYCRVLVEDNGPGISDKVKGKLFDRLSLDTTRARGSGFGLCLTKILVEDFGGSFGVEDRVPGDHAKGARFAVLLPLTAGGLRPPEELGRQVKTVE